MLIYILFGIYLIVFSWMVSRTRFFVNSGITQSHLIILFLIKVIIGIAYGWIGIYDGNMANMSDTWSHHFSSLKETQLLFKNPWEYCSSFFHNPYDNSVGSLFASENSYWNDLKNNIYIRFISVINCFTFGNYYINVIFFSYITFFGIIAVYRVMCLHLSKVRRLVIMAACFLTPSFLYWSSGLHKDGLCFLAISAIIYLVYTRLQAGRFDFKSYAYILLSMLALFALRNHLLVILLPALLTWLIAAKFKKRALLIFGATYVFFFIIFFGAKYLYPSLDFPQFVTSKQEAFLQLQGGQSTIPVKTLEPSFPGFVKVAPQAFSLSALRPYWSDVKKLLIIPAYIELLCCWTFLLLSLFCIRKNLRVTPFGLFVTFFTLSLLLMIGYTNNNLGATVRYRSIIFPLIMPFILGTIQVRLANYYK